MNWQEHLAPDEKLLWQARPAPRCFTFRNWPHSLFGAIVLVASTAWFLFALDLGRVHQNSVLGWIPVPFLAAGLYLTFGHLVIARLEWGHVFYALTDRRLVAVRGLARRRAAWLDVNEIIWFELHPLGPQLGTVRVRCREREKKLVVSCIEYPRKLTDRLEAVLAANGIATDPSSAGM